MISIYEGPVSLYRQEVIQARSECYICQDPKAEVTYQALAGSAKGGELLKRWGEGLSLNIQVELPIGGAAGSSRFKVGACEAHGSNLIRLRGLIRINNDGVNPLILDISRRRDPLDGVDLNDLYQTRELSRLEIARRFPRNMELQQAVCETRTQLINGVVTEADLGIRTEWNYWMNNRSRFFEEFMRA